MPENVEKSHCTTHNHDIWRPVGRQGTVHSFPPEFLVATRQPSDGLAVAETAAGEKGSSVSGRPNIRQIVRSQEFIADLGRVAQCLDREQSARLEIGEVAAKWIDDHKYHRQLNPARFAQELKRHTGKECTGKSIENYVKGYRIHAMLSESGMRFPHLGVAHLVLIANSKCADDEERCELARRVADRKATVRQVPHIACQLRTERERAGRIYSVRPSAAKVRMMDGLDLIMGQPDGAIDCLILDRKRASDAGGRHVGFPAADPVRHLCDCLQAAAKKLSKCGMIFIFHTSVGLLDRRIEDIWMEVGFKHAGQLIWRKTCGAVLELGSPLAVAHEHIHLLCRREVVPKSMCGYVSSVTPKWSVPVAAHTDKERKAVQPDQKPVELMELLISIATRNGLVVDPYAGSGSCGVAAVRLGCGYVGAEIVPEYARLANERIVMACGEVLKVTEAINFMLNGANPSQAAVMTSHIEHRGLVIR